MKRTLLWLVAAFMLGLTPATSMAQQTPGPTSTVAPDGLEVGEYDGPQGDVGVHWVVEGLGGDLGAPVVTRDLVLMRQGWTLVAYTQDAGDVAWEYSLDGGLSDPAADDSQVYVTGRDQVIALDAATGDVAWETNLWFGREAYTVDPDNAVRVAPVIADDVVYAVAGPIAYALDTESGGYIWRQALSRLEALAPPVVTTSTVAFTGRLDGESAETTVALDREDGTVLWPSFDPDSGFAAAMRGMVAHDDLIVALDEAGDIVVRNAMTGGYNWYVGCFVLDGLDPRIVIVGSEVLTACSGRIAVFDLFSGNQRQELGGVDAELLGAFGPTLVLRDAAGTSDIVRAIDSGTGEDVWTHAFPASEADTRIGSGSIGSGRVFVTTRATAAAAPRLIAIGGTDGPQGAPLPSLLNPPAAGSFATIATETNLRAAPSVEGVVWATLPAGARVLVTGAIEEVDGVTWWEIVVPETGEIGWAEPAAFKAAGND